MTGLVVELRPDPKRGSVPVRFGPPGGRQQEVDAVLDWWPGEGHRYFRVRVRDGSQFVLRQDLETGEWRMDWFRADAE